MLVSGILADRRVAIVRESPRYSNDPPFHPSENVAEFPGQYIGKVDNPGFRAVRQALADLKLDGANWKTSRWNPFGQYVNPGETVFLKPNLVAHFNHGIYDGRDNDTDSLVTNGSVLRAVVDYVAKALDMRGTIIVGDCPIQGTYWDDVIHLTGLDAIKDYAHAAYPSIDFQLRDYRLGRASVENGRVRARIV
ncbi:MAG: DUF362 domain-containing protein, partial [Planctomycetales bacterium]|nr:DUF362 domain-containing protein [Planctomycetales bacterium]